MNALNSILELSFNTSLNMNNIKEINISEKHNIKDMYNKLKGFTSECNICYSDDALCIQCYQCEFKYCETCLIKVVSEFSKCSACQVNLINSYKKLITVNTKIIDNINKSLNTKTQNSNSNNSNNSNNNSNTKRYQNNSNNASSEFVLNNSDILSDILTDNNATENGFNQYEIEQAILNSIIEVSIQQTNYYNNNNNNTNTNTNIYDKNNTKICDNNNANICDKNITNKNKNICDKNNAKIKSNNINNKTDLEKYIETLQNNEILPYNITSLNDTDKIYNFTCYYDTYNKLQIYSPANRKLYNIEINYEIFNTTFQSELRVLLISLINYPANFNTLWSSIHNIFYDYNKQYKNDNKIKLTYQQKNDIINFIKNLIC